MLFLPYIKTTNMRKIKTGLLLAFSALAFVIVSSFSTREGNPSVHGGGTAMELGEKSTFSFNAVQEDDGTVEGHLVYHVRGADISFEMDIDCMTITGNRATLSGTVHTRADQQQQRHLYHRREPRRRARLPVRHPRLQLRAVPLEPGGALGIQGRLGALPGMVAGQYAQCLCRPGNADPPQPV